jgi:hypothetical protein
MREKTRIEGYFKLKLGQHWCAHNNFLIYYYLDQFKWINHFYFSSV